MNQPIEVGPYRVLRRLGEGGMAQTFVAERTGPGGFVQRVCLKRVRHGMQDDPELVRQFLAEARIMATLQHATIAQVLDFGQEADGYYLALEFVDGLDLRQLLDAGGPLSITTVFHLAVQLTTALDIAHRSGIVHRDISPSNVLLSLEGEVRLTDFGIARVVDETRETRTGVIKGKYPYMAPEYVATAEFDARTDLFGLGVLLYECLTGHRPYDGATELETLTRAATGAHTPLAEAAHDATDSRERTTLFACVEQLLRPSPEDRQQSAASVLDHLTALPADARSPRRIGELVRMHRRSADDDAAPDDPDARDDASDGTQARPDATAALAAVTPRNGNAEQRAPSRARSARAWLAVAGIGISAGVLGGHTALQPTDPVEMQASDATTANVVETTPPRLPEMPKTVIPRAAPEDAGVPEGTTEVDSRSMLTVVVIPYGEVTIDGRSRGNSPVHVRLQPGKHIVIAKPPGRTVRRQVNLRAGTPRRLVIK